MHWEKNELAVQIIEEASQRSFRLAMMKQWVVALLDQLYEKPHQRIAKTGQSSMLLL